MTRYFWILTLCLLLGVRVAYAQGAFILSNPTAQDLDPRALQIAAQAMVDRGATVGLYLENTGDEAALSALLRREGLSDGARVYDEVIVIYLALDSDYAAIRYGERWADDLSAGQTEAILAEHLDNPDLNAALLGILADLRAATDESIPITEPLMVLGGLLAVLVGLYVRHLRRVMRAPEA